MKPIKFKEQNTVIAKNQSEYEPLPAFHNKSERGELISCWKLSFGERVRILFTGRLWVSLWSFNRPINPMLFSTRKSDVLKVYYSRISDVLAKLGITYYLSTSEHNERHLRLVWRGRQTGWARLPNFGNKGR